MQTLSRFDALINEFDRALKTLGAPNVLQSRATPKAAHDALELSEAERKHSAGLMRVNRQLQLRGHPPIRQI